MIDQDNQDMDHCSLHNKDLETLVQKLHLELEEKENEIVSLKKIILKLMHKNTLDYNHESNDSQGKEEEVKSTEPCCAKRVNNTTTDMRVIMHSKKILFHGRKDDGKPRPNNIVQIHYTIVSTTATAGKRTMATITSAEFSNKSPQKVIIEDSRERRNGKPFEFILGTGQIMKEWEDVIEEMFCGEVICVNMTKPYYSVDSNIIYSKDNIEYICRIELIGFWEYDDDDECKASLIDE